MVLVLCLAREAMQEEGARKLRVDSNCLETAALHGSDESLVCRRPPKAGAARAGSLDLFFARVAWLVIGYLDPRIFTGSMVGLDPPRRKWKSKITNGEVPYFHVKCTFLCQEARTLAGDPGEDRTLLVLEAFGFGVQCGPPFTRERFRGGCHLHVTPNSQEEESSFEKISCWMRQNHVPTTVEKESCSCILQHWQSCSAG